VTETTESKDSDLEEQCTSTTADLPDEPDSAPVLDKADESASGENNDTNELQPLEHEKSVDVIAEPESEPAPAVPEYDVNLAIIELAMSKESPEPDMLCKDTSAEVCLSILLYSMARFTATTRYTSWISMGTS
jgi:archaellum component FlaD/FlaE